MKNYIFFILFLGLSGCSKSFQMTVESSGTKIVTGICGREVLASEPELKEWYESYYSKYLVDKSVLAEIDSLSQNVSFVIFLGTWCSDSKREVPHFLKIIDEAEISSDKIIMHGLDRSKRSSDGMTDKYNILRVPTFIVLKGEEELGRIVEFPQETLEKDLAGILNKQ